MKLKIGLVLLLITTYLQADIDVGKEVYFTNCAACHSNSMSGGMGKDFNIVSYTRTKDEIKAYTSDPSMAFRKFGYSANAMPTLPLSEQEVNDVTDYIDSLQPFKKWMRN